MGEESRQNQARSREPWLLSAKVTVQLFIKSALDWGAFSYFAAYIYIYIFILKSISLSIAAAETGISSGSSQDSSCARGRDQMITAVPSGLKRSSKKR